MARFVVKFLFEDALANYRLSIKYFIHNQIYDVINYFA